MKKVSSNKPTSITSSATYVIDVSKLAHPDDVKVDDLGIWHHSGSHPQCFKVTNDYHDSLSITKEALGATGDEIVYLRRLHSFHPSNRQE
jgi:predicted naringenin-chalcone synthase